MIWLRGYMKYVPTRLQPDLDNASVGNLLTSHLTTLIRRWFSESKRIDNSSNNNYRYGIRYYWFTLHDQK